MIMILACNNKDNLYVYLLFAQINSDAEYRHPESADEIDDQAGITVYALSENKLLNITGT